MSAPKFILETERTILREFTEADAPAVYRFNSHPEVVRYTGDKAVESVEQMLEFIKKYEDYGKYGYGRWAVVYKDTNEVIGFNGLKYLKQWDGLADLGYRFLPEYWGKGIATETSLAVVKYGFEVLKMEKMIGFVQHGNPASAKVLEKCGMTYIGEVYYDDQDKANDFKVIKFELNKPS